MEKDKMMNPKTGFTTGSCAAAAAKAASKMLLEKTQIDCISIMTPSGAVFTTGLVKVASGENSARCGVIKPDSDDPDVTSGLVICVEASFVAPTDVPKISDGARVIIEGGEGIGKVTKPGLDRPVGDWAINSVPRQMIKREVQSVMDDHGYNGYIHILVYAPKGYEISQKTFNSRLGIEGGISIIGTTGIVEPMSTKAVLDTIRIELRQKKELGMKTAVVAPGNYGISFLKEHYGYDLDRAVKCSNHIGETIDMAREMGFEKMLLIGHVGKLIKLAGGIMNTHSLEGDCRMEIMAAAAAKSGASPETICRILDCITADEAYRFMVEAQIEKKCTLYVADRIDSALKHRAGSMPIGCVMFSNKCGIICVTGNGEAMLREVNIK